MTTSGTRELQSADWQRPGWLNVPTWAFSLAFHMTLLILFQFALPEPVLVGDPNSTEREVGIYFKAGHDAPVDLPGDEPAGDSGLDDAQDSSESSARPSDPKVAGDSPSDSSPPVALSLPQISTPRIGLGNGPPGDSAPRDVRDMIKSTGTSPAMGTSGSASGGGGTTFFGQKAKGQRFVYVLDASGSMYDYNAIGVAKTELLASLAQLDADQQFQIIFYSERCYPMVEPGGREQMFRGTDANRMKASQFVRAIQPLEGTRHREALLEALNYTPDVIFFLTDAGEPRLDAGDLDRIRRRNNGRSRIHCIEFGKGAPLDIDSNFLKKLARENGGGYAYRDITKFQKE